MGNLITRWRDEDILEQLETPAMMLDWVGGQKGRIDAQQRPWQADRPQRIDLFA